MHEMIVLHNHVPERNLHRFYALQVAPNLFGDWSLVRSWGCIGTPGRQRISWHDTRDAAEQACGRLLQAKQRRGYRVPASRSATNSCGGIIQVPSCVLRASRSTSLVMR
jgi:predicted DNA-binding WGR domain protein